MAASNKYDIIKISLANRDGAELKLEGDNLSILFEQIKPNRNNSRFEKMIEIAKDKIGRNILLVVATRKLTDLSFKIPLQGKYLSDVSTFKTEYQMQEVVVKILQIKLLMKTKENNIFYSKKFL